MTWADGLAFFTSAISRIGPGPARASRKSRTGGADSAWTSSSSSGSRLREASTSFFFEATMSSRIVAVTAESPELPQIEWPLAALDPHDTRPSRVISPPLPRRVRSARLVKRMRSSKSEERRHIRTIHRVGT